MVSIKSKVARGGTALVLSAALAVGMVPTTAFAEAADAGGSEGTGYSLAAEAGFVPIVGKTYTVPMTLSSSDATTTSMASRYLGSSASAVYNGSSYTVTIYASSAAIESVSLDGIAGSRSATSSSATFVVSGLSSLEGAKTLTVKVGGAMAGMSAISLSASFDTSGLQSAADFSALNSAISDAEALLAKAEKNADAQSALSSSIATAKTVANNAEATQTEVDNAKSALDSAVATYNEAANASTDTDNGKSDDKSDDKTDDGKTDDTQQDSSYEVGVTYAVPISITDAQGSASMAGRMMGANAYVTLNQDGSYQVAVTVNGGDSYYFDSLSIGGVEAAKSYTADGSYLFTATVPSVSGSQEIGFGYTPFALWRTMSHSAYITFNSDSKATGTAPTVATGQNKTALNGAVAAAKQIEQGDKSDAAFATLSTAIQTAEAASANAAIPQAGIDAVTENLIAAVQTFNASSASDDEEPATDDVMAIGKEYTVAASLVKQDGTASMAAGYFDSTATVVWDGSAYQVTFGVTSEGQQYIKSIAGADGATVTDLGSGKYQATVSSLESWIALSFGLETPVGAMTQTGYLKLDTASLPGGVEQKAVDAETDNNATTNNSGSNNNATTTQETQEAFQVGHTYQVPIWFAKQNSSETSMADQYFGGTALVRPQSDGTFLVTFAATAEGLTHIVSISYNGTTLSQSGSEFTFSIPRMTSDAVFPLSMTIKEMQQLGAGAQVTDLHLYLSQATDLGTGQESLSASSSKSSAQTGDTLPIAGLAGLAALAAAGAICARPRRHHGKHEA